MSSGSPLSPSEGSILSSSSDLPSSKVESTSKTLKISKKSKKAPRSAGSTLETEGNTTSLGHSGSSSSLDSRSSHSISPMPTVDEDNPLEVSSPRRGSGPMPVTPKLKSLRTSTQPSSEKLTISKKKPKSPREGDDIAETSHSKPETLTSKLASSHGEMPVHRDSYDPLLASDDETPIKHKKKKLTRPASSSDMHHDGIIEHSSASSSSASYQPSPKSNRRKSARKHHHSGDVTTEDKKRIASGQSGSSSSLSSNASSSSIQSASVSSPVLNKTGTSSQKSNEGYAKLILPSISFSSSSMVPPSPPQQVEHTKQLTASLLIDVLRSPRHLALLKAQMSKERCDENLDFWIDAQRLWFVFQLQKLETNAAIAPETIIAQGMPLYNTYLEAMSTKALNLPAKVGARLRHAFKAASPTFPITPSLFVEAQTVSFKVIESDPFPRFLKSSGNVVSPSNSVSVLGSSPTSAPLKNKEKNENIKDLIQLSAPSQIAGDIDDFLAHLDECNRNTKLKWSKVHDERTTNQNQPKIQKLEHHGVCHLKAHQNFLSNSDPEAIANYIADTQLWKGWFHPGATILELERISPQLSVVWLAWSSSSSSSSSSKNSGKDSSSSKEASTKNLSSSPSGNVASLSSYQSKKYDRYTVLYVATRHEGPRSMVVFCSLPHSTAPVPHTASQCSLLVSGFNIESTGPTPQDPISIEMLVRADKSEFKKWDKDSLIYADALQNLQNMLR